MSERSDRLKELLEANETDQAMTLIKSAVDYHEGERFVFAVLRHKGASQEMIDAVLETFISTRQNWYRQHGTWVHSLSHFTEHLWRMNQMEWVKKLNKIAFDGVLELGDANCSDRLVGDFFRHSNWDMDPKEFHLSVELLEHFKYSREYGLARLAVSPFESEDAFKEWEARYQLNSGNYKEWSNEAQNDMVNAERLNGYITTLNDLGLDVTEFNGLLKQLLEEQVVEFEEKAASTPDDKPWIRERAEKAIEITKAQLAELD